MRMLDAGMIGGEAPPLLEERGLRRFASGCHPRLASLLGARAMRIAGRAGVRFSVWAPNARQVSVVGDFNDWDPQCGALRLRRPYGVWEGFVTDAAPGAHYKFAVHGADGHWRWKADPLAQLMEAAPATASVVAEASRYRWRDGEWVQQRSTRQCPSAPLSIYEVHPASWWRPEGRAPRWDELARRLIPYVESMGFTHIQLMPLASHPFGGSWGYQPIGLYAPQAELGEPQQFRRFVDHCHARKLGVIIDWVPAHFPDDAHGLARFDGTALYEHADPREGRHPDWNTLIYNYGRNEVRAHLIGSALHWLEQYHLDGLRVDAVASMLYRDYSRAEGEWIPNCHGGRENHEAVAFLQQLNEAVHARFPGVLTIAEESTAWPGVTAPVAAGGLGFSYKWNMGWMHDTLGYMAQDPVHRRHAHAKLGFGLHYAFSERYVLPLSHDEVVHGKRSLIGRMPGDRWQRFANLRAYYGFMWAHPGKKLLFMGGEFAQAGEWQHEQPLDWPALQRGDEAAFRHGVVKLTADLNRLLQAFPALHACDAQAEGFEWLVADDAAHSVIAFLRRGAAPEDLLVAVCNFTPVPRHRYRLGLPHAGCWQELLNTDADVYGGAGIGNLGTVHAVDVPHDGQPCSAELSLPPLATLYLGIRDRTAG